MKKTSTGKKPDTTKGGDKSYVIKHIPPILWRGVKMRAAERGETVKTVMINLLVGYAAGDIALD